MGSSRSSCERMRTDVSRPAEQPVEVEGDGGAPVARAFSRNNQPFPARWTREAQQWSQRNDARRIDIIVREIVVPLDVLDVHRLRDARLLNAFVSPVAQSSANASRRFPRNLFGKSRSPSRKTIGTSSSAFPAEVRTIGLAPVDFSVIFPTRNAPSLSSILSATAARKDIFPTPWDAVTVSVRPRFGTFGLGFVARHPPGWRPRSRASGFGATRGNACAPRPPRMRCAAGQLFQNHHRRLPDRADFSDAAGGAQFHFEGFAGLAVEVAADRDDDRAIGRIAGSPDQRGVL